MYSFCLYDSAKDVFLVARDVVGIIPLYLGYGADGSMWFASEVKALQTKCDHIDVSTRNGKSD